MKPSTATPLPARKAGRGTKCLRHKQAQLQSLEPISKGKNSAATQRYTLATRCAPTPTSPLPPLKTWYHPAYRPPERLTDQQTEQTNQRITECISSPLMLLVHRGVYNLHIDAFPVIIVVVTYRNCGAYSKEKKKKTRFRW